MKKLRLLIVDDEPLIRSGIRSGLSQLDGIEIVAECGNGAEAIARIQSERPDLVLLDVQMPDCTGLDVVRTIGPNAMPMVIFVTAFDRYALNAFEVNAVDYLLKPFDDERLRNAIARARERLLSQNSELLARHLKSWMEAAPRSLPERFVIRNGERYEFVSADSVDWFESANNYVQLHCGPKTHLLSETLSALEHRLDSQKYIRVHRGHIVNVSRIVAIHSLSNGVYEVELRGGMRLATGRQYKQAVIDLIRPTKSSAKMRVS